ncbi:MAG: hypothetical protein M3Z46_07205 [Actinomycetota bacterium]|nr:hypothetical protein [Actinomycetota bacterium]
MSLDPEIGEWPSVVEEPGQGFTDLVGTVGVLEITIHILDGRLQAVQRALQVFEDASVDDQFVVAQAVGGGQLAGDVGLLAAAGSTELTRSPGPGPDVEPTAAPPAPLRLPRFRHVTKY